MSAVSSDSSDDDSDVKNITSMVTKGVIDKRGCLGNFDDSDFKIINRQLYGLIAQ